ncbi:MAG: glycosyl hydrolase family 18 protein [Xanthobacter sp.]
MSNGTFADFLNALRAFESGVDWERYQSGEISQWQIREWVGEEAWTAWQNGELSWRDMQYLSQNSLGFVGYQLGEALLIDTGYYEAETYYGNGAGSNLWQGSFTGKDGVESLGDLKSNVQEAVILAAFGFNLKVIEDGLATQGKSLDDFIGTTASYVDSTTGQTIEVTLTLTGILAAAHLRGAWGTLALLQNGVVSTDENGTSILKYIDKFGGYDSLDADVLRAAYEDGTTMELAETLWQIDIDGDGAIATHEGAEPGDGDDYDTGGVSSGEATDDDAGSGDTGESTAPTGGSAQGPDTNGVTTIMWAWNTATHIDFDPAQDKLDFGWFSGSNFTISEVDGSIVIAIPSNNQTYVLDGVALADLSMDNILANDSTARAAWETAMAGVSTDEPEDEEGTGEDDSGSGGETSENPDDTHNDNGDGTGEGEAGEDDTGGDETPVNGGDGLPTITTISWAWGTNSVLAFEPEHDQLDFGWFSGSNFTISQVDGSTVIDIPSNNQTYVLDGVSLSDLSMANIIAKDASAVAQWETALAEAGTGDTDGGDTEEEHPGTGGDNETPNEEDTGTDPGEEGSDENHEGEEGGQPSDPSTGSGDESDGASGPIIAAYYTEWSIYGRQFNVADVPAENLTHLIYAFAKIDSDGKMALYDRYAAIEKTFSADHSVDGVADTWDQTLAGNFNQLAELKAANPELSVLIAVGGWTLSGTFSDVAATAEGRANFAASAVEFLQTYTMFDGLDFDWEYPGGGGLDSNVVRAEDGENYALLLAEVRAALDELEAQTGREYEISVASPAGSDKIANFNLEGLAEYVDFFNLMAYDFHGSWESTTGHQAPLYDTVGGDYDVATAVQLYLEAGIDSSQIVLGAPAYTRAWSGVEAGEDGGWNASSTGLADGTWERGVYDYKDLLDKLQDPDSGWTLYWDDEAQAAYVYNEAQGIFSTFETPASIALKSEWAQAQGLGGMMFWDLSGDTQDVAESLIQAAYDSWVLGLSFEEVIADSSLTPDVVIGGNGKLDSLVSDDGSVSDPSGSDGGNTQQGDTGSDTDEDNSSDTADTEEPDSPDVSADDLPVGGAHIPVTTVISWQWGVTTTLDFDEAGGDMLDFGWMTADAFEVSEEEGTVVISIPSNAQSYRLEGVSLDKLSLDNISARDAATLAQWSSLLDTADAASADTLDFSGLVATPQGLDADLSDLLDVEEDGALDEAVVVADAALAAGSETAEDTDTDTPASGVTDLLHAHDGLLV